MIPSGYRQPAVSDIHKPRPRIVNPLPVQPGINGQSYNCDRKTRSPQKIFAWKTRFLKPTNQLIVQNRQNEQITDINGRNGKQWKCISRTEKESMQFNTRYHSYYHRQNRDDAENTFNSQLTTHRKHSAQPEIKSHFLQANRVEQFPLVNVKTHQHCNGRNVVPAEFRNKSITQETKGNSDQYEDQKYPKSGENRRSYPLMLAHGLHAKKMWHGHAVPSQYLFHNGNIQLLLYGGDSAAIQINHEQRVQDRRKEEKDK